MEQRCKILDHVKVEMPGEKKKLTGQQSRPSALRRENSIVSRCFPRCLMSHPLDGSISKVSRERGRALVGYQTALRVLRARCLASHWKHVLHRFPPS